MSRSSLPVDSGLLERFRAVQGKIAWKSEPASATTVRRRIVTGSSVRVAHLHDEDARVEAGQDANNSWLRVDSGPLGALILILEMQERGMPSRLEARQAGQLQGFGQGAIEAAWSRKAGQAAPLALPLTDVVELARYALA